MEGLKSLLHIDGEPITAGGEVLTRELAVIGAREPLLLS